VWVKETQGRDREGIGEKVERWGLGIIEGVDLERKERDLAEKPSRMFHEKGAAGDKKKRLKDARNAIWLPNGDERISFIFLLSSRYGGKEGEKMY